MNWVTKVLNYLGRILLPARLRPTVLQSRLQSMLDRTVGGMEKQATKATGAAERLESGSVPRHSRIGTFFRWFFHFVLIAGMLVLLYYVNRWFQLERVLRSDWPTLHAYWLPLLFVLLYCMAWLGWWIWELTGPEKLTGDFPDIDQAWREGLQGIADAGVDLRDAPLFLVIGKPTDGEDNVLLAAQFGFKVRDVPRWPEAPIRFSANEQSIFVTTSGASVLGRFVKILIEDAQEAESLRERLLQDAGDVKAPAMVPAAVAAADSPVAVDAAPAEATPMQSAAMITDEQQRIIGFFDVEEQSSRPARATRRRVFLKNKSEVQSQMARLQHLCQLLRRQRQPFCPINGILVLLPQAASDNDEDAAQATSACQLDLSVLQEVLQVRCPVFVLNCDTERVPGFREFLQRIPAGQRERRLGQRFPLVADVETGGLPKMVQEGLGWFCYTFLPTVVYNLFRVETSANGHNSAGTIPEAVAGNFKLYQFLSEMRQRRKRLTRFLARGLMLDGDVPFMLGGFYLAGTGSDAERDRGFVGGVFQRLPENQNFVAWADDALRQEIDFRRWTRYAYVLLAVLLGILVFLIYRLWIR